jgi:hypothetical protein
MATNTGQSFSTGPLARNSLDGHFQNVFKYGTRNLIEQICIHINNRLMVSYKISKMAATAGQF